MGQCPDANHIQDTTVSPGSNYNFRRKRARSTDSGTIVYDNSKHIAFGENSILHFHNSQDFSH